MANFIIKTINMDIFNYHINECLANVIINKQLPIRNKNNLCKLKKMYLMLKVLLFRFQFAIAKPDKIAKYKDN